MIIYSLVLLLIGIFTVMSLTLFARGRWPIAFVAASCLSIFVGFRDHVGGDWDTYELIFDAYHHFTLPIAYLEMPIEPGYALLNFLSGIVGADIHLVNFICALLMMAGILIFAKMVQINPNLALFLSTPYLIFVVGMGYTRQSVAIGIGLAAFGYLVNGRRRMFYLCVCIATLFHYSAIFLFLFEWLATRKRLAICALATLASSPLILMVIRGSRYSIYVSSDSEMYSSGVWFRLAIEVLGAIAIYIQRERWRRDPKLYALLKRGIYFLVAFLAISFFASTFADRFALYLMFVYILGLGCAVRFSQKESRYVAVAMVFGVTCAIFVTWFEISQFAASSWLPYKTVLF
jgi:hypothetical protein